MFSSKVGIFGILIQAVTLMAQIQNRYSPSNLADQCSALRQAADALCGNVIASCPIPPKNCTELLNFDFLYIMDESGSIESFNQNGFEKEKQFLKEFTNKYTIGSGPKDSRAGLIAFGTVANVEFLPGQYNSNDDVTRQIDAVQFSSGNTNIRDALLQAADVATLPNIRRQNVPLIVILLTDGKSNIGTQEELTQAATELREIPGVELFAIGIKTLSDDGNSSPTYDKDELLNIVGDDQSHFFEVDSFDDLALSGDLTARDVCECILTKNDRSTTAGSVPTVTMTSLFTGSVTTVANGNVTTTLLPSSTSTQSSTSQAQTTQAATTLTEVTTEGVTTESSSQPPSTPMETTQGQVTTQGPVTTQSQVTTRGPVTTQGSVTTQGPTVIFRTQTASTNSDDSESTPTPTQAQGTPIIVTQEPAVTLGQ